MTGRGKTDDPVPREALPLWRRLFWFVGLWLAGIIVVGSLAFLIRTVLRAGS